MDPPIRTFTITMPEPNVRIIWFVDDVFVLNMITREYLHFPVSWLEMDVQH
jgi:hypothetical protein